MKLNTIIHGDALTELKKMPDNSIDCCITSPPYFNLRDYQVKGQIGLETNYQEFIKKLILVFNEVKRILKKDGCVFVNLGDSFNSANKAGDKNKKITKTKNFQTTNEQQRKGGGQKNIPKKSLMLIPHRFAIAMTDAGWILRNTLIWIKPNAMPESVRDRWKKAHEYIFFFTKSKKYYFDLDAIRTPHKEVSIKRAEYEQGRNALGLNPSSVGEKYNRDKNNKDGTEKYYSMPARQVKLNPLGACPPDYLIVNTNCSEADGSVEHYATYPQRLLWPLARAGCPEKGIILDPFMGAGTTAVVAQKLLRNYIGIELNKSYIEIANKRLMQKPML